MLTRYTLSDFTQNSPQNLLGGVTAAIVALPLALAFGISSGIGALAGLYGAVVVGLFAAVFGGTRAQISGPTGPMSVVMAAMTAQYTQQFPEQGLALAFTTVLVGGLLQILMGLLRLGRFLIMVPYPVISGFMSGVGVIIIILQLGPLLGGPASAGILAALEALPLQLQHLDLATVAFGLSSLLLLFCWRGRANALLPSPLLVLIASTLAVALLPLDIGLATIGKIPTAMPQLLWPVFEPSLLKNMLFNACMLAMLGAMDSLLTSLVADNLQNNSHNSNRELIGQGLGNTMAGLIGGLPGAGATMRTVVNIRAGGEGPLSGVVHALVVLSAVLGLGFLFENIPLVALSAVLIKVGVDIIDWPFIARFRQLPLHILGLMLLVLMLTVFVDLITAVFVGVFIKNVMLIDQFSKLELGHIVIEDGTGSGSQISETEYRLLQQQQGEVVLVRITGPLTYAVSRGITQLFNVLIHRKLLVIDLSCASFIGISTLLAIENLAASAMAEGKDVHLIVKDSKHYGPLRQQIGSKNCYSNFASSLASAGE